jgi:hypothetical protein
VFGRSALCYLNHTPSPFCFSYFSDRVLIFLLGIGLDLNLSNYDSVIAGITGACWHAQFVG